MSAWGVCLWAARRREGGRLSWGPMLSSGAGSIPGPGGPGPCFPTATSSRAVRSRGRENPWGRVAGQEDNNRAPGTDRGPAPALRDLAVSGSGAHAAGDGLSLTHAGSPRSAWTAAADTRQPHCLLYLTHDPAGEVDGGSREATLHPPHRPPTRAAHLRFPHLLELVQADTSQALQRAGL